MSSLTPNLTAHRLKEHVPTMTTQRNINTQALPCAVRSCVLALRAWLMSGGMQRSMATVGGLFGNDVSALTRPNAGLKFINGPGGQTTRMFVAGALLK